MSYDDNMEIEYADEDPYQSDPDQDEQSALEDMYYEATELLRKDRLNEAVRKFQDLIEQSKKVSSTEWIPKSWNSILTIKCRENSPQIIATIESLLLSLQSASKKDAQNSVKAAIDNIKSIASKELCKQAKTKLINQIRKKSDDTLKIRTYLRIAEDYLTENALSECKMIIDRIKALQSEGKFPEQRASDFKLELCCLEIQYLQKINSNPQEIKAIIKNAQLLKSQLNDSRVNAILHQNIGKMLVVEGQYEKADKQLLNAFKQYTSIGDERAKNTLKYAAFIGMLSKQEINPFTNVQAQVYNTHEDIKTIELLRGAFEARDITLFNKYVSSEYIVGDPFLAPLVDALKQIVCVENLKEILKPYEKVGFDFLSAKLKIRSDKIQQYVFQLIVEGEVRGQINSIEGYFEKDRGFDNYLQSQQDIIESYINYLETTS